MSCRYRDAFGRVQFVEGSDARKEHYIDPSDGRLVKLFVQEMGPGDFENTAPKGMTGGMSASNWVRTGPPKKQFSPVLDLVYWTYASVLEEGTDKRRWDKSSVIPLAAKWIPSSLLLMFMLLLPYEIGVAERNGGYYDPVRYRDWGYPKVPRNKGEAQPKPRQRDSVPEESMSLLEDDDLEMRQEPSHNQKQMAGPEDVDGGEVDEDELRGFGPRYLCFLQDGPEGPATDYQTLKVSDWLSDHDQELDVETDYVFISYTRKQFFVATDADLARRPDIPEALRPAYAQLSRRNRDALLRYGIQAARSAGKRAFWLDFECIRDVDGVAEASSQSYDVYRICDIVRAASSMVIVVGPPVESQLPGGTQQSYSNIAMIEWLQQWGTRLWTLPEILLCSNEHRIKLYAVGGPMPPEQIAKRNFVARAALPDASKVRQLIDHYEATIHLTPLELVSLALECLAVRSTDQFNNGDIAYALMGLLRRRPLVNRKDSSFEAFARLSFANDSDKLLERLLCVQPQRHNTAWHEMKDAWGAFLWDIEPHCQVAGIVDDQTVSLDGAYGASIRWDSMKKVAYMKRPTLARTIAKIILRTGPVLFLPGLILIILVANAGQTIVPASLGGSSSQSSTLSSGSANSAMTAPGAIFLSLSLLVALLSPYMLLNIYGGKFWSTQALFIGMEGIPDDLGSVEKKLFGYNHGRLKWSAAGSSLSRHALSPAGECVALPPEASPRHDHKTDDHHEGTRLFTIVDTYSMVATAFRAERPPTAVMVCGQEGGMQRAVLCSYDWKRATFAREAVVRMTTPVLDRMFRVNRFRFALRRRADVDGMAEGIAEALGEGGPEKEQDLAPV